jgi:large subunit ribosomal protein L4
MSKIDIKDVKGKSVGSADLTDSVFGIEPNVSVMHEVVRSQRAARRAGTHAVKNRSAVSGGGKKPLRQKGSGHARRGTMRAPQFTGGGVVFGPTPRSYAFKVNKKVVKLAMRSALSAKLADEAIFVVDSFDFEQPRTKDAAAVLDALGISGRVTVVVDDEDVNAYLSFRNIPQARVIGATEVNTYDLLDNKALLLTSASLKYIEEVLA